ncbi:PREDICTED: protein FAM117B-like [Priapulus caudatus]|uniref:Protein FAM117B-like n=1 Tax=Priapulus caudatus TaxID=37621 RepID=A0ABM1F9R2_PRICU|nr:PREDICTED: protein FAM117B-like [Priapulus caudatus]
MNRPDRMLGGTKANRFQRSPLVDRSKVRGSPITRGSPNIRRTASLDTIYLTGQWPKDSLSCTGKPTFDKATQTPNEWIDDETERKKKEGSHKRSSSVGSSGGQHIKDVSSASHSHIRQKLRSSKESKTSTGSQRQSPLHGNHAAIGPAAHASHSVSRAIPIPGTHIPKGLPRIRIPNSVEGLNQEIEKLVLKHRESIGQQDEDRVQEPTPDGHRAPVAQLITSMTQTPSGTDGATGSGPGSRCQSVSPLPFTLETSEPSSRSESATKDFDRDSVSPDLTMTGKRFESSPKPDLFIREPPDGCEKIKTVPEEARRASMTEPLQYSPIKPNGIELRASSSSAFCPLTKNYYQVLDDHTTTNHQRRCLQAGVESQ